LGEIPVVSKSMMAMEDMGRNASVCVNASLSHAMVKMN
jgi:hypothetical protein